MGNRMQTWFTRDQPLRQVPFLFSNLSVFRVLHHHVGGQAMAEGAHFPGSAAGGWLAGQRERAVTGGGDLSGQQVDVIDQVVDPDAAGMLIHTHGPEGHHLGFRIGVQLRQFV